MKFDKKFFNKIFKHYDLINVNSATQLIKDFINDTSKDRKLCFVNGNNINVDEIKLLLWDIGCGNQDIKSVTAKRGVNVYKLYVRTM